METKFKVPKHVIILGAGPAGLATGHEFTANGGRVTVLDRNPYVGGLCVTLQKDGYKFDIGGHRWFTKNEHLNNWFRRLMAGEIVMVNRISRIFHQGKFFGYPIAFGDVIRNTDPFTVLHAGFSFLGEALRQSVSPKPIRNMRDAYTAQFGDKLYRMFFEQYSEKVWGKPCEELSSDWVSQRSKGLSVASLVRNALMAPKQKAVSLIEEFMYPRDGYVRIPERMAEDIISKGSEVRLNATVNRIVCHGPHDYEVFYDSPDGVHSVRGDAVVSTIPLGHLVRFLEPKCAPMVLEAANRMQFRDLVTVNLMLKKEQVTPDTWLYVQDKEILFGRIHEPKNWSRAMVPDQNCTSLVLECFCSRGDTIWSMSDDEIAQRCVSDLTDKLKFIKADEVIGHHVVRTIQAYPVYDLDYLDNIALAMDFVNSHEGVYVVGRGGTFRYNNADHSIEMGLLLGRKLLGYNVDHMSVNTESEYHEIIQSEEIKRDHYGATVKPKGSAPIVVD